MTINTPYISSAVMDKVIKIAAKKYHIDYDAVGVIMTQSHKKEYMRKGKKVASDVIHFVLFDNCMDKIGIVKRPEVQRWQRPAAKSKKQAVEN